MDYFQLAKTITEDHAMTVREMSKKYCFEHNEYKKEICGVVECESCVRSLLESEFVGYAKEDKI